MLTRKEFCLATGATARQVDYWITSGIVPFDGDPNTGSGRPREYDEELVELVKTLVRVSKAFNGHVGNSVLLKVSSCYEQGYVVLDAGITLFWKTDSKETENA